MPYGTVNADRLTTSDGYTLGAGNSSTFKNRIINGAMGIWQRGTSGFTSSGNYSADRWLVATGTSLSAVGQSSDVPSGFKFSLSTAGTNTPSIRQYIESVNCTDLVGQSVTVSVWIKQTSGAGSNAMYIYLAHANSSDNFSGLTQIGSTANITTTSSWVQYTATFNNLPAGAANGVALIIGSNSSGASTFLVTGVQLEVGSTATSFDTRSYGTELQLCQRYCYALRSSQSNGNYMRFGLGEAVVSTSTNIYIPVPATMRIYPSITTTGTASNYEIYSAGAETVLNAVPTVASDGNSPYQIILSAGVASGLTAGRAAQLISNNNQTSYLIFSAEL